MEFERFDEFKNYMRLYFMMGKMCNDYDRVFGFGCDGMVKALEDDIETIQNELERYVSNIIGRETGGEDGILNTEEELSEIIMEACGEKLTDRMLNDAKFFDDFCQNLYGMLKNHDEESESGAFLALGYEKTERGWSLPVGKRD